jgi:hypothetical protein
MGRFNRRIGRKVRLKVHDDGHEHDEHGLDYNNFQYIFTYVKILKMIITLSTVILVICTLIK